jgi:hypothetical protein
MLLWALHSKANFYYHAVQTALCLLAVVLYIVETYRPDDDLFSWVEIGFGLCFFADYTIQCGTAFYGGSGMMLRFVLSNRGLVDLLSIVPVLAVLNPGSSLFSVRQISVLFWEVIVRW